MTKKNLKSVEFSCVAPKAESVFVAGSFNGWNPKASPMSVSTKGEWNTTLKLAPGRYEFKFIVDGEWCCEPGCEGEHRASKNYCPNEMGTMNRVLEVA